MSDQESQTQGPVESTGDNAASVSTNVSETQTDQAPSGPVESATAPTPELSLHDKMKAEADKHKGQKPDENKAKADKGHVKTDDGQPQAPKDQDKPPSYQPNLKYKAFGKERELDKLFASLVKDPESERKVKEVFTRADAFDDMKQRYEGVSQEFQKQAQTYQELDKDVKRVMKFRNDGDLDNFFASVQLTKQDVFSWAKRQLDLEQMSPDQQTAYQQGVQARAENAYNQQNYQSIQAEMAQQKAEMVKIQLDHTLTRPEVSSTASAWDTRMGENAFRNLVIQEAANNTMQTGQVWSPDEAVKHVVNKFGKLLEQAPSQTTAQAPQASQGNNSAPSQQVAPVMVQGKPVIPNVNGRGTSPIKQSPKSLAELREMGRQAQMADFQPYQG